MMSGFGGLGRPRVLSAEPDEDDSDDAPLLDSTRQLPIALAVRHATEKRGVKDLHAAVKHGASVNLMFEDDGGVKRLPLHRVIEKMLLSKNQEAWEYGEAMITQLFHYGASSTQRDTQGRTPIDVLKTLPLDPHDRTKEERVRLLVSLLIKRSSFEAGSL
eukprot:m.32403 g.32403  ORF g.32403 m.32403 type:complete len:160 (+) comp16635_c1_seq1:200-679(+)